MELIHAIALLCQLNNGDAFMSTTRILQLECHQYYVHCVAVNRTKIHTLDALEKCILEKK